MHIEYGARVIQGVDHIVMKSRPGFFLLFWVYVVQSPRLQLRGDSIMGIQRRHGGSDMRGYLKEIGTVDTMFE